MHEALYGERYRVWDVWPALLENPVRHNRAILILTNFAKCFCTTYIYYTCKPTYATYVPIQMDLCVHMYPAAAHMNSLDLVFEAHTRQVGEESIPRLYRSITAFLIQPVALGIK